MYCEDGIKFPQPDLDCTIDVYVWTQPRPPANKGDVSRLDFTWHGQPGDVQAAQARAESLLDAAGRLPRAYDPEAADHLRIYGVLGMPADLVSRYLAHRPPVEFDWGLLGLQKITSLAPADRGDIPQMLYQYGWDDIARRTFSFSYAVDAQGATELTVTETPQWARNDGTWVSGTAKVQIYRGTRYNAWRDTARQRIFEGLKTWLPRVLVALGECVDVPAGEALSGGWLAANHAAPWSLYLSSGRKELITASITADTTAWLDSTVPAGVVEGVESGTVRELILGALR